MIKDKDKKERADKMLKEQIIEEARNKWDGIRAEHAELFGWDDAVDVAYINIDDENEFDPATV